MEEIWKIINNTNNMFSISNLGKIRNNKTGKILKTQKNKKGYHIVRVTVNQRKTTFRIHRLVAESFIPNPNNLPEVHHKDNNTYNSEVSNLQWCTRKENLNWSYKTMSSNRNYRNCILLKDKKQIGIFDGITKAAKYASDNYNVSYSSLKKYLFCGNFEIVIVDETNRKTIYHKKQIIRHPVKVYKGEEYLGIYKTISEAYKYIKKEYGISITKTKPQNTYIIKGFTIERIIN